MNIGMSDFQRFQHSGDMQIKNRIIKIMLIDFNDELIIVMKLLAKFWYHTYKIS